MKNNRIILTDINQIMSDMFFTQMVNPLQREYYALMIKRLLKNDKGYDLDEKKILMLIKRLNQFGYSITTTDIYLTLTQQEIDSIPAMSDNDITNFCITKFNQ